MNKINQIKSNQINFIGIKIQSLDCHHSHIYTITISQIHEQIQSHIYSNTSY